MRAIGLPRRAGLMALKPLTYQDPLFQILRDGNVKEFNRRKGEQQSIATTDCDFRHLDLRGLDASAVDFSNSYLRGIDSSQARLEGASLNGARISGALFPAELGAERSPCRSTTAPGCAIECSAPRLLDHRTGRSRPRTIVDRARGSCSSENNDRTRTTNTSDEHENG